MNSGNAIIQFRTPLSSCLSKNVDQNMQNYNFIEPRLLAYSGNAVDLHLGGACFEFQVAHPVSFHVFCGCADSL